MRWESLLDSIEALRGKPVTAQDELAWNKNLGFCGIEKYKGQLHMHSSHCNKGRASLTVRGTGVRQACDACRQLADGG